MEAAACGPAKNRKDGELRLIWHYGYWPDSLSALQNHNQKKVRDLAVGVKLFLCIVISFFLFIPAFYLHFFIVLVLSGSYNADDQFWNPSKAIFYVASYIINALIWIPLVGHLTTE
jgi:hypothetical protein